VLRLALLPHRRWIQGFYRDFCIRIRFDWSNDQASFAVSDVENNIKNTGMSAVRSVLGLFPYDKVSYP
jgi:hypothetical protein